MSYLSDLLTNEQIRLYGVLPASALSVTAPHKIRLKNGLKSAVIFAVPYRAAPFTDHNLSLYAVPRDYHLYFSGLFDRILPLLEKQYPTAQFRCFADNSPINERDAAIAAGLGVYGDSGLILTDLYGSYVFLGEILSDLEPEAYGEEVRIHQIVGCEHCGACRRSCPRNIDPRSDGQCLSALSQKKGELTPDEQSYLLAGGSVWGCDVCQTVCPHNRGVIPSPIPFFAEERITHLTRERLLAMSDKEFAERAYSWRGTDTILRNLTLFENAEKKQG